MLRESDYNRLAASFHQVLQDYSCQEECQGLGMPEDTACSNFINYYKLVRIVLWRQALEYVLPKHARHIFKKFMAQLQQSLPEHQRKKQYGVLMDTLGSISNMLQQDQGVVKLAQQCVTTFATTNSEDPAARVMRLTRQTLEHLQRTIEQLHSMRDQGFNDLSSALAVAFAPAEPAAEAATLDPAPLAPPAEQAASAVATTTPQLSPRDAALAAEPLLVEPEDDEFPAFSAEEEVEELHDLAPEPGVDPAMPPALAKRHAEAVVEMESFRVVHGEAFVPLAQPQAPVEDQARIQAQEQVQEQAQAETAPGASARDQRQASGEYEAPGDGDEFEFMEDPEDDLAAADAMEQEPELIDLPIEVLDAPPRQRGSRVAGGAASFAPTPETSPVADAPGGLSNNTANNNAVAQAPAAIIIPMNAAVPERLDLPPPDTADAMASDDAAGQDGNAVGNAAGDAMDGVASGVAPVDGGDYEDADEDDEDGGAFNIILGDEDEEYALTLDDEDDETGGLEAEKIPAPPPESLFEISEPPPLHLSHGRITSSPPLETSSRPRSARPASRSRADVAASASGPISNATDPAIAPARSANPGSPNGKPVTHGHPSAAAAPAAPAAPADPGAPASPAATGRAATAGKKASERRRHIRVNAEGLSVFINDTARQLPISNLSEHGLAVYHEGWAFAVDQAISLDLMTSYKVLMKDLHCRVIRCDAKLMACKFIEMDRQSQLLLRAIIKRLLQIRSKQAASGGKSDQP